MSPFSSTDLSLWSVVNVIRAGRACLCTNVHTTLWTAMWASQYIAVRCAFMLPFMKQHVSEWPSMFQVIVMSMGYGASMAQCKPAAILSPQRPSGSLTNLRALATLAGPVAIFFITFIIGVSVLHGSSWYTWCALTDVGIPAYEWTKTSANPTTAFWMQLELWHAAVTGYVFSFGFEHRKRVISNVPLNVMVVLVFTMILTLIWSGPNQFTCIFAMNCDAATNKGVNWPVFKQLSISVGQCFTGPPVRAEGGAGGPLPATDAGEQLLHRLDETGLPRANI